MNALQTAVRNPIASTYDVERIRADFPILGLEVNGRPLVYLDNAASSQMPRQVIDRIVRYQTTQHANVNRGVHYLSETATFEYEEARRKVQRFINAGEDREVIFTSGTTDAINLVTNGYGRKFIGAGDEIILTTLEHHSRTSCRGRCWPRRRARRSASCRSTTPAGCCRDEYEKLFNARLKFVALLRVSNALGTINPVKRMIAFAHAHGVPVLIDGAQAVPHLAVDVRDLDCDFYAFSGHKMCGPTGIGILHGKASLLEAHAAVQGRRRHDPVGDFREDHVQHDPAYFSRPGRRRSPRRSESAPQIDYLSAIGMDAIAAHEHELLDYATAQVSRMKGVRIIGTASRKASVLSFTIDGVHPHDVGTLLNDEGIAVRTGHHCAQPVMQRFHVPATSRASFALYNTMAEVDALVAGIRTVQKVFA
jgi:cysteine desulfurase/selenocysteine lyase